MTVKLLRERMSCWPGRVSISFPRVRVKFGPNGEQQQSYMGMVDSGAAYTIIAMVVAHGLGLSVEEIKKGPSVPIAGIGGTSVGYECRMDMVFVSGSQTLRLSNARLYFTESAIPVGYVLIGQHDALERLIFVQRPTLAGGEFVLRVPP